MSDIYGGSITDIFKQLLGIIDKGLSELSKYGIKVQDKEVEETEDGQKIRYKVFMGDDDAEVYVQVVHNNETKKCTVTVVDKKGNKVTQKDVKPKSVNEVIRKFGVKYYDTDSFVESSKRFKVTLQKITSAKQTSIELTDVFCNSVPGDEIYQAVTDAVEDDEFADMISDEPKSFEFIDNGSEYEFSELESIEDEFIVDDYMIDILSSLYSLYNATVICSYSSWGQGMIGLKEIANNIRYNIQWHTDQLYEIWSMTCDIVQPFDLIKTCCVGDDPRVITFDIGTQLLATHLSAYINKLRCYFCLIPVEYQVMISEWIRTFNSELMKLERSNYVKRP